MFRFVVRRLRWIARVPFAPQIFDAVLTTMTMIAAPRRWRAVEALEQRAREALDATPGVHRFGGTAFLVGGCELGHVHGNGLFDAFVGRENRDLAIGRGMAVPHHVFPSSGWVSLWMRDVHDVDSAMALLQMARDRIGNSENAPHLKRAAHSNS